MKENDVRAPDLASPRQRPSELDADDRRHLGAPAGVEHHAQNAVDTEPRYQRRASVSFMRSPSAREGLAESEEQDRQYSIEP